MKTDRRLVEALNDLLARAFAEDGEDVTTLAVFGPKSRVTAEMVCREAAVVAGKTQGALARRKRFRIAGLQDEAIGGKGVDSRESRAVTERRRNLLGCLEVIERFLNSLRITS